MVFLSASPDLGPRPLKSRALRQASIWITLWIVVFGVVGVVRLSAETPAPVPPARHVDDRTGFLRPETFSRLDQRLVELERRTGSQIVVTLLPSLPAGEALEDYVRRVFNAWKIGEANRNNGILFAVFIDDHRMRIEVGSGLSRRVPNALAARILRDTVAPHFRSNDIEGGVTAGVDAMLHAMKAAPIRAAGSHEPIQYGLQSQVTAWMIVAGVAGATAGLLVRGLRTRNEPTASQVQHAIVGGLVGGVGHALAVYAGMEYHWILGLCAVLFVWLWIFSTGRATQSGASGWDYSGSGYGPTSTPWWGGWGWGNGGWIHFGRGDSIGGSSFDSSSSSDSSFGGGGGGGDSGFSGGGGSSDGGGASGSW